MSIERVREYMAERGRDSEIREFSVSSATVELAAKAVGVEGARIAKTLSFYDRDREHSILVVAAGDCKVDNSKFKHFFGMKAKMLSGPDVEAFTGHAPGGVCPFANPAGTEVYLDESLRRFETVFPACGSGNSAIELTCPELEELSQAKGWVDVCKEATPAPAAE
ncbi:MAG TPA: YbaK/EbsC family protein [Candidatus Egerieimonas intestinavium]|uniref:YbaK/EbsC family protein n=1 Tax=Candidatus Egerieimonas intestinavium TaxID=2840777 RepID=A0A9D1JH90_9FIRM|nr:YbaK/EbsC family protein [Candidatus Egerieimonas intestinavium]